MIFFLVSNRKNKRWRREILKGPLPGPSLHHWSYRETD